MQKGELESFGKSFPLPNGSCEISVAGKNSKSKDPGRCLWEGLGFGAPTLGTGVLGPCWEMHPYEMWARVREDPKHVRSCHAKNGWEGAGGNKSVFVMKRS